MANNTTLRDGNGALFTAESVDVGSGVQRTSTAANLRVGNADVTTSNPVPMYDAFLAPVNAGPWTSATTVNTAFTLATSGYDTVVLTIAPTGTITAGIISFEVFDNVNWIAVKAPRTDSYQTDAAFTLTGGGTHAWQVPVAGFPSVRARLSTAISGSGSVSLVGIVSSSPDVSLVTVGLDPSQPLPAGTNTIGAVQPAVASLTDRSTTVGTAAAQMIAANAARTRLVIANPDPVNDLWVAFNGVTAAVNGQGSIRVPANGGTLSFKGDAPVSAVSAIGAIASQKTTAWEG